MAADALSRWAANRRYRLSRSPVRSRPHMCANPPRPRSVATRTDAGSCSAPQAQVFGVVGALGDHRDPVAGAEDGPSRARCRSRRAPGGPWRAPATSRRASRSCRRSRGRRACRPRRSARCRARRRRSTSCTSSVTKRLAKPRSRQRDQRVAADELALVRMHEAVEPGFVGGVLDRQLACRSAGRISRCACESIARMPNGLRPRSCARLHQRGRRCGSATRSDGAAPSRARRRS